MQAFGVYFDVVQAAEMPRGPFGLSILSWGFIFFTMAAISVIAQLWWHIYKIEGSYLYSLSFDKLEHTLSKDGIQFRLHLSNNLDKPVEYNFIAGETNVTIGDNPPVQLQKGLLGTIISAKKSSIFQLPVVRIPSNYPCKGLIRYRMVYGPPQKPMFQQIRELILTISGSPQNIQVNWIIGQQKDCRIKGQYWS